MSPQMLDPPPRHHAGYIEFPLLHVRGGTSTGLVISERWAPEQLELREELLRHLMGLPLEGARPGNKQITGLGRIVPTGNKVFFARMEEAGRGRRIVSTFAQLAADKASVDWSVNCGNMTAALPLWALETGNADAGNSDTFEIDIFNTNTNVAAGARMRRNSDGTFIAAEIPGVDGSFPAVDLFLANPVGAKTGQLLPTGRAVDEIAGYRVSCVDVAVPMVIARAADFGKTGHDTARGSGCRSRADGNTARHLGGGGSAHGTEDRRASDDRRGTGAERDSPEGVHRRRSARGRAHRGAVFHAAVSASVDGGVRRVLPGGGGADPWLNRA